MKKEDFEILSLEYLRGTLSENESRDFEHFLKSDVESEKQLEALKLVWESLDKVVIPEPSPVMDQEFFNALDHEIEQQRNSASAVKGYLNEVLNWFMKPQLAYGLLLLVVVWSFLWNTKESSSNATRSIIVDSETEQVREKLVLTLLEQSSANKRLEGVSEANKIVKVDEQVINALLRALNKDPNVNVRLAAIESLTNYVENPKVRQGLIQSIPNQESPIIQVTLANLMLALEERKSIEPFKRLLEKPELDTTVKKKIEKTIKSII